MLHDNGGTAGDLTVNVIESGNGRPHHPKFEGNFIAMNIIIIVTNLFN